MATVIDNPLSSMDINAPRAHTTTTHTDDRQPSARPLVLRGLRPAPIRDIPDHVYDPQRQIATDPTGAPLAPNMAKDWTSLESTHTDGDGGDNETWQWEEQ